MHKTRNIGTKLENVWTKIENICTKLENISTKLEKYKTRNYLKKCRKNLKKCWLEAVSRQENPLYRSGPAHHLHLKSSHCMTRNIWQYFCRFRSLWQEKITHPLQINGAMVINPWLVRPLSESSWTMRTLDVIFGCTKTEEGDSSICTSTSTNQKYTRTPAYIKQNTLFVLCSTP